MSYQCEEKRIEDIKELRKQQRRKETNVKNKLEEANKARSIEVQVKKERQRLIQEDAKKRIEFKKRNDNFKKLQVLDKH